MEEATAELRSSGVHVVLAAYSDDVTLAFQAKDAGKVWRTAVQKRESTGLPLNAEQYSIWTCELGTSLPDHNAVL
eukprot:5721781-Alexandrium_andersonii.AAC.1